MIGPPPVVSAVRRTVTVGLQPEITYSTIYSRRSAVTGSMRIARRAGM